jgi:quercetin dioxygenase-like cupin family protein
VMQMRGREDQIVREEEFFVVPRGIPHCAKSEGRSYVIMFQSKELESVKL